FNSYDVKPLGIPVFYKKKIIEQLKDGTYFCLRSSELNRIGFGCVLFKDIHIKYENGDAHIKLTNSQRKQLLKQLSFYKTIT
ncbi:MAG: hypothetical protein WD512_03340, partial [Candidatus Paceibacterota bacterium]